LIDDYKVITGDKIFVSGRLPQKGKIDANNTCDVSVAVHNDKWCASKDYTDDKIIISDYKENKCGSSEDATTGNLLVDKIQEIRGSELTAGVNLGIDEYDMTIANTASDTGYYESKNFTLENPNNYILINDREFRILSITKEGIEVVDQTEKPSSYVFPDFVNKSYELGIVRRGNFICKMVRIQCIIIMVLKCNMMDIHCKIIHMLT
jgi:hypothetical protein